jgi:hypothetical protein
MNQSVVIPEAIRVRLSSLLSVTQYFYDVPGPTNTVPEPGMIGLFSLGLGALFIARRARAA